MWNNLPRSDQGVKSKNDTGRTFPPPPQKGNGPAGKPWTALYRTTLTGAAHLDVGASAPDLGPDREGSGDLDHRLIEGVESVAQSRLEHADGSGAERGEAKLGGGGGAHVEYPTTPKLGCQAGMRASH